MPAEEPYVSLALLCSINYFAYFLLITNLDYLYITISNLVFKKNNKVKPLNIT